MFDEIWKDIPEYLGIYQASSYGRIKSLNRLVNGYYNPINIKEKILSQSVNKRGYKNVSLWKNNKGRTYEVHLLVAKAFLNHKPNGFKKVVDHKDNNKLNNHINNLQIITNRENSSKDKKGGTSKYIGVSWYKKSNKWQAGIRINGKAKFLGYFKSEKKASDAYQKELKKWQESQAR